MKEISRTQTGVRLETRLLKVLKALATELDLSLGDLLEGIVLHAFEGKTPFSAATLKKVRALRAVYGLDLTARDSHQLQETTHGG
jgi:predicted DNA-binding ribbon-helix-helix protein